MNGLRKFGRRMHPDGLRRVKLGNLIVQESYGRKSGRHIVHRSCHLRLLRIVLIHGLGWHLSCLIPVPVSLVEHWVVVILLLLLLLRGHHLHHTWTESLIISLILIPDLLLVLAIVLVILRGKL